ncbi:Transcriptional repressor SdpR [bioreactor metagenome]|jgi:DNA-binding transcriptional ArsR family regulator|uniref:Transcriptional repressor SdpR n=1 Tax=bioreactor metagenome TaxID=1076179 RepID=A0A645I5K9_9ZZZZ
MGLQDICRALADPTRREILSMLQRQSMPAGQISSAFNLTGATVSHHLSILKQAGLVSEERHGKQIIYQLDASVLDEVLRWFATLKGTKK